MSANLRVSTIEWGRFRLDGGAMFGVVPRTIWQKTDPPDDRNRIELAARGMLVRGKDFVLLVDCGCGDKMDPRLSDIYDARTPGGGAAEVVAGAGLDPGRVTHVVITHLHFDHAGGCTTIRNGSIEPTFPNARYLVQARQLAWARSPSARDRASFFDTDFEPLAEAGLLVELDGDGEVAPGVSVHVTDGHTPGLQMVRVDTGDRTFVFPSDVIPTSSHLPLPFVMGYDLHPLVTLEEKRAVLDAASAEDHVLVFEHDPRVQAATVKKGKRYHEVARTVHL